MCSDEDNRALFMDTTEDTRRRARRVRVREFEGHGHCFGGRLASAVYGTGAYASRGSNPMSNLSDGIFRDSLASELVTPTGSPTSGYAATFQVGVAV
jgi:hypothetical protein